MNALSSFLNCNSDQGIGKSDGEGAACQVGSRVREGEMKMGEFFDRRSACVAVGAIVIVGSARAENSNPTFDTSRPTEGVEIPAVPLVVDDGRKEKVLEKE